MNTEKAERLAQSIFSLMLESELNEAEAAYGAISAICMRCAVASRTVEQLLEKLENLPGITETYAKANLSGLMSAMISKEEALRASN